MAFKLVVLLAAVACAQAGYLGAPGAVSYSAAPAVSHVSYASPVVSYGTPAITTQHQNILRSPGNLAQVSTYSKTIDTPFSSVSKSDVRVSNPGYATYAAPAVHTGYASYAAPATYAAPAIHASYAAPALVAKTFAAPAIHASYAAPAIHTGYAAPALASYAAPAIHASYAAPAVVAKTYGAPALAAPAHGLIGTAYSAAPAVAHVSYSGNYGLNYAW